MAAKRTPVAVLISGRGSNLGALLDAAQAPDYPAQIALVISNRSDAAGLKIADSHKVTTAIIDHTQYEERADFDAALDTMLTEADVAYVCLAGFMRLLGTPFVNRWRDRLINIHPSLLPAFRGLNTHQRVLDAGVRITGCTVHFVRPELDDGPIIVQGAVPVHDDDTEERLAARVLAMEHKCYPAALRWIAEGRVQLRGERVLIKDADGRNAGLVSPPLA